MTRSPATPRPRPAVATLADVAREAGVSAMTVSRVVGGEAGVRPATRERVQAAMAALKYVPGIQGRQQAAAAGWIRLGVVYSKPSAGYLSEFLVDLLHEASHAQVQLIIERFEHDNGSPTAPAAFFDSGLDAVVITPPLCDLPAFIESVAGAGLIALQVASARPDPRLCAVGVDDYEAAARMTRHLVALGHQRIAFITGRPAQTATASRLAGFRDAMQKAGLPVLPDHIAPGAFTYSSGLDAAETLLVLDPRPTAIFASNDDMAAATVSVAHRLGLDVPGDLTVVGFDDTPIATTIWPELTTIRQPIARMAAHAVELLVRQVRARRAGEVVEPEVQRLDVELVRRQSDAAPRRRPSVV